MFITFTGAFVKWIELKSIPSKNGWDFKVSISFSSPKSVVGKPEPILDDGSNLRSLEIRSWA